ncbi:C-X-C chemokine receptor type 1 [Erpetoichthys calabaricus]|uniref:C-X-C chemokine receptor type 1 n=1 Tax=Erpetoichthys calabaricus TaxID=27687 RepID=UPI0022343C82|nr:C-X-C chemokine receptor type 1 [Erpetoichthys calabaricus]
MYGVFDYLLNCSDYPIMNKDTTPCRSLKNHINTAFLVTVYSFVFFLSLLGNAVVVFVIASMDRQKSSTDCYLLNLAVTDLIFSLTLPIWIAYVKDEWIFGEAMCKIITFMQELNFYSGILLLACISVDRYLAIVHATSAITQKRHLVKFVCVGVWLSAVLLSLPLAVYFKDFKFKADSIEFKACKEHIGSEGMETWRIIIRFFRHTIGFFIPLAVMIFCYGFTIKTLFQTKNGQKQKAMKVIFAVVLAFIFCWLPHNVAMFVDTLLRAHILNETCEVRFELGKTMDSTEFIAFTHCCINPILYAFIGQKFRSTFLRILFKNGLISKRVLLVYGRSSSYLSSSGNSSVTL